MDPTAIQTGVSQPKAIETGIQSGLSAVNTNGTATEIAEPRSKSRTEPMHPVRRVLTVLADLRITVVLFALSMILVFYGTIAQVDSGVWTIVAKYFRSLFVLIPLKVLLFNQISETSIVLPFPGGWLLGGAMLVNLLAAHIVRFKLAWNRAGILLIHAGLIIIMLGEVVTGVFATEGQMIIQIGQTVSAVVHAGTSEIAVTRTSNPKEDEVTVVPATFLKTGALIEDERLPFKIEVVRFMVNSDLRDFSPGMDNPATRGFGRSHIAVEKPEVAGVDTNQQFDAPSAYVKLIGKDGKDLGTWLYNALRFDPQWIDVEGKKYQVELRYKQTQRSYSFHLKDFKHDKFPGTETAKDFHAWIHHSDPQEGVERDVEIYMNAPYRYKGETFYQSSWTTDPRTGVANGTILQVVRNPGWQMPYISCAVVGIGMLIHFGYNLYQFLVKRYGPRGAALIFLFGIWGIPFTIWRRRAR